MRNNRDGFTLIELLIVVTIVGILAAIAIPKYATVREKAFVTAMTQDLESLAVHEEIYFNEHFTYTNAIGDLEFESSDGVDISINYAANNGFAVTATHQSLEDWACGYYTGAASSQDGAPATQPDRILCATGS